jgi:hypothetical protein
VSELGLQCPVGLRPAATVRMPVAPEPWLDAEVARVALDRMLSPEMLKGGNRRNTCAPCPA